MKMKAAFIAYNQAHVEDVDDILSQLSIRGFTRWTDIQGRGSDDGEPHLGTHAWPSKKHGNPMHCSREHCSYP